MEKRTYCTRISTSHPFKKEEIVSIFSQKATMSRWRTIDQIKRILVTSKNAHLPEYITKNIKCLTKLGSSPANVILSIPDIRRDVLEGWKKSWPESTLPEQLLINRYSRKYHKMPYFDLGTDCLFAHEDENMVLDSNPFTPILLYFTIWVGYESIIDQF